MERRKFMKAAGLAGVTGAAAAASAFPKPAVHRDISLNF